MMVFALYVGICLGGEPMNISARDCIQQWQRIEAFTSLADCTAVREMRQRQWAPTGRGPMVCERQRQ
jgi:hypothetical protein